MKQTTFQKTRTFGICLSALIWTLVLTGCGTAVAQNIRSVSFKDKVYMNHAGTAPYAVVRQRGFRFWLRNQKEKDKDGSEVKNRYDELQLKPGSYMLGFVRTTPRVGGAAYCKVSGGQQYSFKITDRQYLRSVGSYAFMGQCILEPRKQPAK